MTRQWFVAICSIFVVCLCVQLLIEYVNRADSIGILYSVYSAAIYTLVSVFLIKLIVSIFRRLRKRSG